MEKNFIPQKNITLYKCILNFKHEITEFKNFLRNKKILKTLQILQIFVFVF